MPQFSTLFSGLVRALSVGKERANRRAEETRDTAGEVEKIGRRHETARRSMKTASTSGSDSSVATCSRRGEKGVNQDCSIVLERFGGQEDTIFCGIFDGHGLWGHYVAKEVRDSLPSALLCQWQEAIALPSLPSDPNLHQFELWRSSFFAACAEVDKKLKDHRRIDAFYSGTTALSVIKQGDVITVANVGDSRAVLATTSESGSLVAVQLTVDFKPNLPQEAERITSCNGRVYCLHDELGVHRLWLPNQQSPGLAMSRAFGDHCVKDFGLISEPEVTQWNVTDKDQFVVLATDGVWDVISNEEAVQIVSSTTERSKSAKRLVDCAVREWRSKRRGIAVDDCSAICLFFHHC